MNYFRKFISIIKSKGVFNTLKLIFDNIYFEGRCLLTSIKLNLLKTFKNDELVVNHGKYKFIFYGDGDRAEILYHSFWNKMFSVELNKIKNYVNSGDTVIDVGANIGFFSLLLSELIGQNGKIYAFEPSNRLFNRLDKTVRINETKNIKIINLALGESEGSAMLHYNPKQSGLSSIATNLKSDTLQEEIKITTLDKFAESIAERVSFIKIDTEGFEPQVLKGARRLILKDKPKIYLELGGAYLESSLDALKILKDLNYHCEAEKIDLKTISAGVSFIATPTDIISKSN
jgi:FkbM family methyltransferase